MGDVGQWEGTEVRRNAVVMIVAPRQVDRAAGRAERADDESVSEPDSLGGQPVQVGRAQPREPPLFSLFLLHHGERIVALIVRVNEEQIGPRSPVGGGH